METLVHFTNSIDPAELQSAIEAALLEESSSAQHSLVRSLYERWASIDFTAAIAHAANFRVDASGFSPMQNLLPLWTERDPEAALDWAERQWEANVPSHSSYFKLVVTEIARTDPTRAMEVVKNHPHFRKYRKGWNEPFEQRLIQSIARDNPAVAASYAMEIPGIVRRQNTVSHVVQEWAAIDPDAAWAWTGTINDPILQSKARADAILAMARADPDRALLFVERQESAEAKDESLSAIAVSLVRKDPDRAYRLIDSHLEGVKREAALAHIIPHWAQVDPEAALDALLTGMVPGSQRSGAFSGLLKSVAETKPEKLISLYRILDDDLRREYSDDFGSGLALYDTDKALEWLETLPAGPEYESALSSVVSYWSQESPQRAFDAADYVLLHSDDPDKQNHASNLIARCGIDSPRDAVAWVLNNLDERAQYAAIPKIVESWALRAPADAAEWAAKLPEGAMRTDAYCNLVDNWSESDPDAAAKWLDRMPTHPDKDAALRVFVRRIQDIDPSSAIVWATRISDPEARVKEVRNVIGQWRRFDPDAADRWIRGSDLPKKEKDDLRE